MSERDPKDAPRVGPESVPPDRGAADEQPRWRRDFPIDWAEDEYVSRRDLVKFVVLTSGALVFGQGWIALQSVRRRDERVLQAVPIAGVDELAVGQAKTFIYPAGSTVRLLIKTGPQDFVAYDQACTHLMCPVVPAFDQGKLHCPCHNGWFDLQTGHPTAGPPRRPLPRIRLEVRDGTVYATGVEESGA